MRDDAIQSVRLIEEELKKSGLDVETRVKIGIPLREIMEAEKAENISVIVIGSHGKSNLEEISGVSWLF
ncbi:MAG: universal stress protein [Proteobacteria bacterium]|nr:universal stress protein [Pseudomonadota bacterium]NIS70144.1 universal stress protein [Pseudomonadota bacterium]